MLEKNIPVRKHLPRNEATNAKQRREERIGKPAHGKNSCCEIGKCSFSDKRIKMMANVTTNIEKFYTYVPFSKKCRMGVV
jgi:hypothetical protein